MLLDNINTPINTPIFKSSVECPVKILYVKGTPPLSSSLAYHPEMEIQYIKRGQGAYFIHNNNYPFQKNSLLVIKPNYIHRIDNELSLYVEKYSFCFDINFLKERNHLADLPEDFPCLLELTEQEATVIEVIIRNIIKEKESGQPYWVEVICSELIRFILLIRRAALRYEPQKQTSPLINEIIRYIEINFRQELTLGQIAERFAVSSSHLSRQFKRCSGLNFKQYLTERRIAEAKRLLQDEPKRKVSAIAQDVGQPDFALFNRSFKIVTGLTPSEYRKLSYRQIK